MCSTAFVQDVLSPIRIPALVFFVTVMESDVRTDRMNLRSMCILRLERTPIRTVTYMCALHSQRISLCNEIVKSIFFLVG